MFRRGTPAGSHGPLRGPGGGKVRNRAPQRAQARRRLGLADYVGLAFLGAVPVFAIEYWLLHAALIVALAYAVVVVVASASFSYVMEKRRWRNAPPPERPKRRR